MGWLLLALGLSVTGSGVADGYARYGLVARPGAPRGPLGRDLQPGDHPRGAGPGRVRAAADSDRAVDPVAIPALAGAVLVAIVVGFVVIVAGLVVGPGRWWRASATPEG